MSTVNDAIVEALSGRDVIEAGGSIKDAVCKELSRADSAAAVKRTEYFNHSYVPDVVMDWPDGHHREVFLRFASPDRLAADVGRIGASGPILFDLTVDEREAVPNVSNSAAILGSAPTMLLTDAGATEHLRPDQATNMVEHLVSSNVLRAGHGLLDSGTAERTVAAARNGFDGAMAGNRELVGDALSQTRPIFGLEMELRVERTLQLLWWVGGSEEQQFPVSLPDDMELDARDTQEFLRVVLADDNPVGDGRFWPRLADRLDFETLVSVGTIRDSANLNSLMAAYASRSELSHAAIDLGDRRLPPHDRYSWELEDGFIVLSGPDWICRMTPLGNRFSQRRDEGRAVSLGEASDRSLDYRVEEAEFDEEARQVLLSRKAPEAGAPSPRTLQELAEGFEASSQVQKLTVLSALSRITADFERMLVGADPDVSLRVIAEAAPILLGAVQGDDTDVLRRFLG